MQCNLVGLTTGVPVTAFPNPGGAMGLFVALANVMVTLPGTAGNVVVTVEWSNGLTATGSQSLNSSPVSLATTGETGLYLGTFFSVCEEPISYSTVVSGVEGQPVYTLRIRLVSLG